MRRAHTTSVGHSGRENRPPLVPALDEMPAWLMPRAIGILFGSRAAPGVYFITARTTEAPE